MYRQPNFSRFIGTTCSNGGTDIFEISSACDFLLVPVPTICGQRADIGTVPYSAAFTDSTAPSPGVSA